MSLSKIFLSTALIGMLVSCQQGSSKTAVNKSQNSATDNSGNEGNTTQPVPESFTETKPEDIKRECTSSEAQALNYLELLVKNSMASMKEVKGKKNDKAIADGLAAIQVCDQSLRQSIQAGACRVTHETILSVDVKYYDSYRIDQKCKETDKYLSSHGVRPAKNDSAGETPPIISEPAEPTPPSPPPVAENPLPVVTSGSLRQCTNNEFEALKSSMNTVELALKQISKQGSFENWKYESDTISMASLGTKSCESLIAYHDQNPCERTLPQNDGSKILRQYTGASLRQRCELTRKYFYEFVQNKTTLNFKNADLLLDVSGFKTKIFDTVPINVQGCIIENHTDHVIDLNGVNQVLIKDSRGFESNMMVLESAEGLLIQCYGLKVDGPFSKREVVRLFQKDGTNMPLSYRLK